MTKKVLCIVGCMLLGFNYGLTASMSILFLIFTASFSPDDFLNGTTLAVGNIVAAIVAGVGTYIYIYKRKREHESVNVYGVTLAISFVVSALLGSVLMYIILSDPNNMAGI